MSEATAILDNPQVAPEISGRAAREIRELRGLCKRLEQIINQHAIQRAALLDNIQMTFTVPPIRYPVIITCDKPVTDDGRSVVALIDSYRAKIQIWSGLDGQGRENALRHELWHAWEWQYLTEDMNSEQRCQIFANASQHFDQEYTRQGGLDTLSTLIPTEGSHCDAQGE